MSLLLLLFYVCVCKSVSCVQLCDSMDYTVHRILQVKSLEWVAFPFSRGSLQLRDWTQVSCIAGRFFTNWATRVWFYIFKHIKKQVRQIIMLILLSKFKYLYILNDCSEGLLRRGRTKLNDLFSIRRLLSAVHFTAELLVFDLMYW